MISTSPSSAAASSAPLAAASKKPMPSAFTTSAIRVLSCACAGAAISAAATAAEVRRLFQMLIDILP